MRRPRSQGTSPSGHEPASVHPAPAGRDPIRSTTELLQAVCSTFARASFRIGLVVVTYDGLRRTLHSQLFKVLLIQHFKVTVGQSHPGALRSHSPLSAGRGNLNSPPDGGVVEEAQQAVRPFATTRRRSAASAPGRAGLPNPSAASCDRRAPRHDRNCRPGWRSRPGRFPCRRAARRDRRHK